MNDEDGETKLEITWNPTEDGARDDKILTKYP